MSHTIIELKQIQKHYDDHQALQSMSLDVMDGEFLTLLGPSGCGKTTLLRIIAGFVKPEHGTVYLNQIDITNVPPEKRHINMVFQSYALFPHMTLFENVAFGLECYGVKKAEIQSRVMTALQRVRLDELAHRKPGQLSGGQQQRVAIARAVVNEPKVLLLDEPLSALDYHLRREMRIELKALQRRLGITFILVTHDQEEALTLSDRVVVMNHGRIEQIGSPRDVYEEPCNTYVAQFIGTANIVNTTILSADDSTLTVNITGVTVNLKNKQHFKTSDAVSIIIRPEDIEVWGKGELEDQTGLIPATVHEVIYKGSTVDLIVKLSNGQLIAATEFFDDDDENLEYELNEPVMIRWKLGWEVILDASNGENDKGDDDSEAHTTMADTP